MSSLTDLAALMPSCSIICLSSAIANSTCAAIDQSCICGNQALNDQAASCIVAACTVRESLTALNVTERLCGITPVTNHSIMPILVAFLVLAAVVVAMRILTRFLMNMPLLWDDWTNFAAMLCCIAYTAYLIKLTESGFGTDLWAIPLDDITNQFIGYYATLVIYVIARLLIRISIVLFYTRIFRSSRAERLMWGTLIGIVLISLPLLLAGMIQCIPVSYTWLRWDGEKTGHCIDLRRLIWVAWIVLLLIDIWLLGIPLPFVVKLQLSLRKKLLASAMFCMGLIVVAVSIYKLTLIDLYTRRSNPTRDMAPMAIWAGVEIDLGVICACMPSMPMLFRPVINRFKSSLTGTPATPGRTGHSGSASQYGLESDQRKRRRFLPTISQPSSSSRRFSSGNIRIVTTIHQTEEAPASESHLPLCEPAAIELVRINPGNSNTQGWS